MGACDWLLGSNEFEPTRTSHPVNGKSRLQRTGVNCYRPGCARQPVAFLVRLLSQWSPYACWKKENQRPEFRHDVRPSPAALVIRQSTEWHPFPCRPPVSMPPEVLARKPSSAVYVLSFAALEREEAPTFSAGIRVRLY